MFMCRDFIFLIAPLIEYTLIQIQCNLEMIHYGTIIAFALGIMIITKVFLSLCGIK